MRTKAQLRAAIIATLDRVGRSESRGGLFASEVADVLGEETTRVHPTLHSMARQGLLRAANGKGPQFLGRLSK